MAIKKLKLSLVGRIWKIYCYYAPKTFILTFENNIYQQIDGVDMGSPLSSMLAGHFIVHLERTLIPKPEKFIKSRKRYVVDTITYNKPVFITDVIDILNKFHKNVKFTYEVGHNDRTSSLDD